jgi:hypothetical protein
LRPGDPDRTTGRSRSSKEPAPVVITMDDVLACVTAGHDVVDRVFEFDAEAAWHA